MSDQLLEQMWDIAKQRLPGYVYAYLHSQNNDAFEQPSFFESLIFKNFKREQLNKLSDFKLMKEWQRLSKWFQSAQDKEFVQVGAQFVVEFKRRGLPVRDSKFLKLCSAEEKKIKKNLDELYTLDDMWDWVEKSVCKVETDYVGSFTDIDTIEKLQFAIYTAISKGALGFRIKKKDSDDYFSDDLKIGLVVDSGDDVIKENILEQRTEIIPIHISNLENSEKACIHKFEKNKQRIEVYDDFSKFLNHYRRIQTLKKSVDLLPYFGSDRSGLVFLGLSPDLIELASEQFFTSKVQNIFKQRYLNPLGLNNHDVLVGNIVPVPLLNHEYRRRKPTDQEVHAWKFFTDLHVTDDMCVVALGKSTEKALDGRANFVLPHPKAVVYKRDSGEVARKIKQIKKYLDKKRINRVSYKRISGSPDPKLADATTSNLDTGAEASLTVSISKTDADKQIVYGIVSDPYGKNGPEFDAHADWIPPKDVEEMSHAFVLKIQNNSAPSINIQHRKDSTSVPVESSIVEYPDHNEYKKAMRNQPHKIYRRKFGSDVVHSGSWIMATKLSDQDWEDYKAGKLNAYSIEGTGFRKPMKKEDMPKVEIIDLVPKQ